MTLNGGGLEPLIKDAVRLAQRAANAREPQMFAPPIAGFLPEDPEDPGRAREIDLKEGYSISVECDEKPAQARRKLEAVLGPATVVVELGGQWLDGDNREDSRPKVHPHWRLTDAAIGDQLADLKEARRLATAYVGADRSNINVVHPIRWPGSWHRKGRAPTCAHRRARSPTGKSTSPRRLQLRGAVSPRRSPKAERPQESSSSTDGGDKDQRPS